MASGQLSAQQLATMGAREIGRVPGEGKDEALAGGAATPLPPMCRRAPSGSTYTVVLRRKRSDDSLGLALNVKEEEMTVDEAVPDGLAARAGCFEVGDILYGVDDKACSSFDELIDALMSAGKTVQLMMRRPE